ncbi:hypothetical protein LCGC14_1891790 [marine sediment metagenome]|uniref:Uncharacterized protein n=1 Tax=marine sediment metagenome TaxID=412755 RepID=A0A0F9FZG6_9ZZZZ
MPLTPEEQATIEERFEALEEQIRRLKRKSNLDPRIPLLATNFDVEDAIFNSFVLLNSVTLSAINQTLANFTSIPATYRNLRLVWTGASGVGSTALRNIIIRMNNDSGASYDYQYFTDGAATTALNATSIIAGGLDGVGVGDPTWGVVDIINYADASFRRGITFQGGWRASGDMVLRTGLGSWNNTAASINQLTVLSDAATSKWAADSVCFLYGY